MVLDLRWRRRLHSFAVALLLPFVTLSLLISVIDNINAHPHTDARRHHVQASASPSEGPQRVCDYYWMCNRVQTGTWNATWVITSSDKWIDAIEDYHTVAFHQWVERRSESSVTVTIESKATLDTQVTLPLDISQLPGSVLPYLEPTPSQQSDHPEIVSKAETLIEESEMEVQAVVAILDWVNASIVYDDSFELDNDALSVFRNRSGVCTGYSNLAVALLRAVNIPARVRTGCVGRRPHGGRHAWIEIYYPDAGWIPSDPQVSENLISARVDALGSSFGNWCEQPETTIRAFHGTTPDELYEYRTSYSSENRNAVSSAYVPSWDRDPIRLAPSQVNVMLPASSPAAVRKVTIESNGCRNSDWSLYPQADWISVSPSEGSTRTDVSVSIDGSSLSQGQHATHIGIWADGADAFKMMPVQVWVVDEVHHTYLPLTSK